MSSAIEVLKGNRIEGITIQEINKNNSFNEIISIAQNNYDFLTEQSKNKSISKFNAMRSERLYWKGVRELAEQRKEAIVALEQKEKLKQEITYQLDQIIYTDKIKEDIRRSVWKEVLELMK